MDLFRVVIPGDPVPKGRPRSGRGHHYTPKRTRDAEEALRAQMSQVYSDAAYNGEVGIELRFYCATRRRTDGDNLTKLVTDALQGKDGVYLDDSQILDWDIKVRRRAEGEEPRTEIRVYTL